MKANIFVVCLGLLGAGAFSATAEAVDVDTTTFRYALARVGLASAMPGKYAVAKASFSGKLAVDAQAGAISVLVTAQENMDDQSATDAISAKYGNLRLLSSGEGGGDIVDELMPTPTPDASGRLIYVAPASASKQYGVKTRAQAVYKVLMCPLYCPDSRILYFIAVFFPFASYSYPAALSELNSFACSVRIPADKKELETLKGPKAGTGKAKPEPKSAQSMQPVRAKAGSEGGGN